MTWQPIETAPDDGTMILIALPIKESGVRYWRCACVPGHDVHDDIYLDDVGYSTSDFSHWKPVGEFPEIIE